MDFFDKLGKKASEAYKVTADKTGKLAKEAKLRLKINDLKSQIDDIYTQIGQKVYQKHNREENYDIKEILEEDCTHIDVLSAEVESILKECLELKDKKQCQNCYKEIEKNVKFCPECGAKQDEDEIKEVEVVIENKEENEECEDTTLEKTVKVESDPKIEENENKEEISYDEEDKID